MFGLPSPHLPFEIGGALAFVLAFVMPPPEPKVILTRLSRIC